jgi:hypothetical protein
MYTSSSADEERFVGAAIAAMRRLGGERFDGVLGRG